MKFLAFITSWLERSNGRIFVIFWAILGIVGNCLIMTGPIEILVLRQKNTNKGGTDTRKRMDDSADYKRRP